MNIRDFEKKDREAVLAMVDIFYHSPGVLHEIPVQNFADAYDEMCNGGSAYMRGLLIEVDGQPAGYCLLSLTYSVEAGGRVVLVEEVFIAPGFRSGGLGGKVFQWLIREYSGKAARLRLEVAPGNPRALALYKRLGFEELPYTQMILEEF